MKLVGQKEFKDLVLYKVNFQCTQKFRVYNRIFYFTNQNIKEELLEYMNSNPDILQIKVNGLEIIDIYNDNYYNILSSNFEAIVRKEDTPAEKKEDNH